MLTRRKFVHSVLASSAMIAISPDLFSGIKNFDSRIELGACLSIDNSELIKRFKYNYLEEIVGRFFLPAESDEKFAENLSKYKASGIKLYAVNSFLPATLKCVGPDVNTDAILKYAETLFRRMEQTTTKILVFGSGGSRRIPDGYDKALAIGQFIDINRKLGPLAQKYKVTIVLEPLNYSETNLLNTVEEGIELTGKVNHTNIGLLADLYHMLKNGETAGSIVKAGKLLKHTHIAEKEERTAPGIAGDDFRPFFAALKNIQYQGKLSIECRWKDLEAELPLGMKTIRDQMESV